MTKGTAAHERAKVGLLKTIGHKLLVTAVVALVLTVLMCGMFAMMHVAALFAFWGDAPSFPWFMLRFFVAFCWMIAVILGAISPAPDHITTPKD